MPISFMSPPTEPILLITSHKLCTVSSVGLVVGTSEKLHTALAGSAAAQQYVRPLPRLNDDLDTRGHFAQTHPPTEEVLIIQIGTLPRLRF